MTDEKFVENIVKDARFHLRQKLDDEAGEIPVIQLPYRKKTFYRIIKLFPMVREWANVNHLEVDFVKDGSRHLRWYYKFEATFEDLSSSEE